jgi:hypothetical protein
MEQAAVSELMDKWMNDDSFRASLRKDPEGTIAATGHAMDEEQLKAFRAIDWSLSDEELTARASNQSGCCCSGSC